MKKIGRSLTSGKYDLILYVFQDKVEFEFELKQIYIDDYTIEAL
jgi:hypothetical protein